MEDQMYSNYTTEEQQGERLALGLAYFSIGLGLAELVAPRSMARLIGSPDDDRTEAVLRACGARELANGLAILAQPRRADWLWSRVGGDALDLVLLGSVMRRDDAERGRAIAAAAAVAGVMMLDVLCARQLQNANGDDDESWVESVDVKDAITVNKPIAEVYCFWKQFENLPRFMRHLESVEVMDTTRSRWRASAPAGATVEWEAEVTDDRADELIAWRSVEGATVPNSGVVRFTRAPGDRGTEVRVHLQYEPPAGRLGHMVAWLFGEAPEQQIREDLRRFKQLMELGEIPLSDGPSVWRPAQPPADPAELKHYAGVQS